MKKRCYLSDDEAKALGIRPKKPQPGRVKFRVYLDQEQQLELNKIRHSGVYEYCRQRGIDFSSVKEYWDKTKEYSVKVRPNVISYNDISKRIISEMDKHSPSYAPIKRDKQTNPHLLVLDPADVHIGKLATSFETGEDYNQQIAVKRVKQGIKGILSKSSGFNIEKILLIIGNDILHIDTPRRTTTSGTPQDTDGMWYENFLNAKKLYVDVIESLLSVADVHVTYNPSNHDYTNGFFLADVISSWFRNCENVSFDVSIKHRKYYSYGQNLIGTTHGDGAKIPDLPLLMAVEANKFWSKCKHRYVYTHHVHHKNAKDYAGVTVESLRSPSGTDSWHHRNGYQHNPKAVEGFLHHPKFGQVARLTHIF
jgi:hypothetical protein